MPISKLVAASTQCRAVCCALALSLTAVQVTAQEPVPVSASAAKPVSDAPSLALTGSLRAPRRSLLSATVAGQVQSVLVDLGDQVSAGDPVIELDRALAQRALASLQAQQEQAEVEVAEAQRLAREGRAVGPSGGLSESVIATREAAARVAAAALAARKQQVAQQAEILRRHTVTAPYDAVVVARQIEAGEWAATGTPLVELLDQSRLQLDVLLPQQHAARVAIDQTVVVRPDALPDTALDGIIRAVVPAADAASRALRVRIDVTPGTAQVLPGMSATAGFRFAGDRAVQVPRDAILRRPDSSTGVWVVESGDTRESVAARRVRVGRRLGDNVEIVEGLTAGERVVTHGNEGLTDGQVVRLVSPLGKSRP